MDRQICLLRSGACHDGHFFLSPTGSLVAESDGTKMTAVMTRSKQLRDLIDFRNAHVSTPYMPANVIEPHEIAFVAARPVKKHRWPVHEMREKSVDFVESVEGASISLAKCNQFEVVFPVLVHHPECEYSYMMLKQTHSRADPPAEWRIPLAILDDELESGVQRYTSSNGSEYVLVDSPHCDPDTWSPYHLLNHSFDYTNLGSIWYLQTNLGVYQTISNDNSVIIQCKLHCDSSILETDSTFTYISIIGNDNDIFHMQSCPPTGRNTETGVCFPISAIIQQCTMLYQHEYAIITSSSSKKQNKPSGPSSDAVAQCIRISAIGTFLQYSDGRIRVLFNDSTTVDVDLSRIASVIEPNGTRSLVRLDNLITHQRCAMDFQEYLNRKAARIEAHFSEESAGVKAHFSEESSGIKAHFSEESAGIKAHFSEEYAGLKAHFSGGGQSHVVVRQSAINETVKRVCERNGKFLCD